MKQSNNISTNLSGYEYSHNGLSCYILNNREAYLHIEALAAQLAKIYKKVGGLDLAIVENCSTLKAITRAARQKLAGFGERWTMDDDRTARKHLTAYLFETAHSLAA